MKTFHFKSKNLKETIAFGEKLSRVLQKGDILCLFGDLGSGKTSLIKGIAKGLKVDPHHVSSPTFVLMNIYEGTMPLYHFDLYRIEHLDEIVAMGYEEFLYGEGVAAVEWADKFEGLMPESRLEISLKNKGENVRGIHLKAVGKRYEELLKLIS